LKQGRDLPACLSNDDLPDFYMADYFVLGLLVASLDRTHRVLVDQAFAVHKNSDYLEVKIDRADQISEIVDSVKSKRHWLRACRYRRPGLPGLIDGCRLPGR